MRDVAIENVLKQIRDLKSKVEIDQSQVTKKAEEGNFQQFLTESIGEVNSLQQESAELRKAFELGEDGVTLPDVMIASQKASIAFEGTLQVRNRFIEAYREVMNMPL